LKYITVESVRVVVWSQRNHFFPHRNIAIFNIAIFRTTQTKQKSDDDEHDDRGGGVLKIAPRDGCTCIAVRGFFKVPPRFGQIGMLAVGRVTGVSLRLVAVVVIGTAAFTGAQFDADNVGVVRECFGVEEVAGCDRCANVESADGRQLLGPSTAASFSCCRSLPASRSSSLRAWMLLRYDDGDAPR
jgi:hypothetical protein